MKSLNKLTKPILQGGMGVGLSLSKLAGAVAKEGGMGVISAAHPGFQEEGFWKDAIAANKVGLKNEIEKAKEISNGNGLIGINVMTVAANYEEIIRDCIDFGADAIISGAGLPMKLPEIVGDSDILIAPIVSSGRAAEMILRSWKKRYDRKPDFIVIEGAEAGGHLGFKSEEVVNKTYKNLLELLEEVKAVCQPYGEIPLFVGGGLFTKEEVKALIDKGAAGVQLATAFIFTEECDSSNEHKEIMLKAQKGDIEIVLSPVGLPGRALKSPLIEKIISGERVAPTRCVNCMGVCNPATTRYCITGALIDAFNGDWENGLFFCGANAGEYNEITTVKKVIDSLF